MAKKVKIGDVFKIVIGDEIGYIQYILDDDEYGYLIRKIEGKYTLTKNIEIESLVNKKTDFYSYIPLQTAVNFSQKKEKTENGNLIEIYLCGNFLIPDKEKQPTLLYGMPNNWSLVQNGKVISTLNKPPTIEQKRFFASEIINHEVLVSRIKTNYKGEEHHFFN